MPKYPFLSDEWFEEVDKIVADKGGAAAGNTHVVMNLVVTATPYGEREMHMGAKEGRAEWGKGHIEGADVKVTTDFETAKEVFVSGNPQAGMNAFMQGKIKIEGDMAKLMSMQQGGGGGDDLNQAVQEITE